MISTGRLIHVARRPSNSRSPWPVEWCQRILRTTLHVVRKAPGQKGFAVIARRWVVERSLAWLTAHRRLTRDYERHPATSEAMIRWAAISGMVRRLTRGKPAIRQLAWSLEDLRI